MSVTIGIDPHEATSTAVAIDPDDQPIAKLGVVAERCQSERLLAGAASFGFARTWAIEPASGWGKLLARQLVGAGESARVRLGGSTTAGKNDSNDALWTAITGLRQGWLRTVRVEDHHAVIRVLIDRYDGLVSWHCCTSEAELDVAPDASSTLGPRAPQRGAGATNVCRAAPGGSHLYA